MSDSAETTLTDDLQVHLKLPKASAEVNALPGHPFLDPHQQRQVSFQMMFEGYPTNVTVTSFSDTIMINISQTNKMGTILSASRILPADVSGSGQGSFNVYTLMGRRDDIMYTALTRRLIKIISDTVDKRLLLSIALHPQLAKEIGKKVIKDAEDPAERFEAYTELVKAILEKGLNAIGAHRS